MVTSAKGQGSVAIRAALSGVVACALLLMCSSALGAVSLPDGRAWEMVSPLEKNGGEINGIGGVVPENGLPEGGVVQASTDGASITYLSLIAFPGSEGQEPLGAPIASQYLSTRKASGWSTEDITTPVSSATYPPAGSGAPYEAFSSDLSRALMLNGNPPPIKNPPLGGSPPGYVNYYLRNNSSGAFEALLTSATKPVEEPNKFFMELLGVTPDLGGAVVSTTAKLSPEATQQSEGNLYEWINGLFQPINVPPGAAKPGETGGGGARLGTGSNESRTISSDGSRVFWSQAGGSLFVRENIGTAEATTVAVDASQGGPGEPGGRGELRSASVDGSRVFFTDRYRLTSDSTADFGLSQRERAHEDLYMFNVNTGHLADITLDAVDLGGASVSGVLEASEDGSYVYFVAQGGLPGTGASAGANNLYMWHEGTIKFIGALSSDDSGHSGFHEPIFAHDWDTSGGDRTARVAAGGGRLLFMSDAHLTSYYNRDASTGLPDEEVYLYNAESGDLTCVSCNPSGARPIGPSGFPGGTPWLLVGEHGTYQPRALSADGSRVFFDSRDALVLEDKNGAQDVYEWEQDGSGTCQREGGCIFLLSRATSTSETSFVERERERRRCVLRHSRAAGCPGYRRVARSLRCTR